MTNYQAAIAARVTELAQLNPPPTAIFRVAREHLGTPGYVAGELRRMRNDGMSHAMIRAIAQRMRVTARATSRLLAPAAWPASAMPALEQQARALLGACGIQDTSTRPAHDIAPLLTLLTEHAALRHRVDTLAATVARSGTVLLGNEAGRYLAATLRTAAERTPSNELAATYRHVADTAEAVMTGGDEDIAYQKGLAVGEAERARLQQRCADLEAAQTSLLA